MDDGQTVILNRRNAAYLRWMACGFFVVGIASLAAVIVIAIPGVLPAGSTVGRRDAPTLAIVALLAAAIGFVLARMGRNSETQPQSDAIPPEVLAVLRDAMAKSADPVGDWTRLAGLAGGTGVFRKLELSGMPLATILMTILFCVLAVISFAIPLIPSMEGAKTETLIGPFMDMAKLTLGAFIGSFVTKGTSQGSDATRALAATAKAVADAGKSSPPPVPNAPLTQAPFNADLSPPARAAN